VILGGGGIGSWLVRILVPYLSAAEPGASVFIVDGDVFEAANRGRMAFAEYGPKAVVLAAELAELYADALNLIPVPRYITARNARGIIGEGDVVFCQPDNMATRRLVERRCARLRDVALFSGGNDAVTDPSGGTFGNVQVYLRSQGEDRTNPLSTFHPEIARPADRPPNAQGCAAVAPSEPQIGFTNAAVASAMLATFYAWRTGTLDYEELYLDIATGCSVPVKRALKRGGRSARL
jgi:molybdopterin/thiamine biosynthesis adenylyltransferase